MHHPSEGGPAPSVTDEERQLRKERIRAQSRAVAEYIASNEDARRFNDDWAGSGGVSTGR